MTEAEQRAAVIAEAKSWLGTHYHHAGRLKIRRNPEGNVVDSGGVDCGQLVWCVFYNCGLTPYLPNDHYPPDFMLHRDEERYLGIALSRTREVADPKPGDIVVYRVGRSFAHGGIVVDPGWPNIIHAYKPARSVIEDRGDSGMLAKRPIKFLTVW